MAKITELAVEFTGDTGGLEQAALSAARLVQEVAESLDGLAGAPAATSAAPPGPAPAAAEAPAPAEQDALVGPAQPPPAEQAADLLAEWLAGALDPASAAAAVAAQSWPADLLADWLAAALAPAGPAAGDAVQAWLAQVLPAAPEAAGTTPGGPAPEQAAASNWDLAEAAAGAAPASLLDAAAAQPAAQGPTEIHVAPTVNNKFELTIQTDLEDPQRTAARLAEALDLVFARKTGISIVDALAKVRADLAGKGA